MFWNLSDTLPVLEEFYTNFLNDVYPVHYTMARFFRVQVSHPEDAEKTRIRMKKTHMQELEIQKGDIVKIMGGKTTHAFCLPLDDNYDKQNEKNFVFLDEASKNIPLIKVSNLTYSNLLNFHFGNLVQVEKSSATKASKIIVKPLYEVSNTGKKDYNLDWLEDQLVVSKGERIVGRHDDPKNIPGFFVIGGIPDSTVWIVDKDTPLEISDTIPENLQHVMIMSGGNLNSVIPVVRKIQSDDFEVTLSSIESYDNCMKLVMYVKDILVHREEWSSGLCTPTIRAWDDLGNQYALNRFGARGGGTQFGDSLWGKVTHNFSEVACILTPALDMRAQELTISVEQLLWDIRKHPRPQKVIPEKKGPPYMMTPGLPLDEKFVIHGGPWEFKIGLKGK